MLTWHVAFYEKWHTLRHHLHLICEIKILRHTSRKGCHVTCTFKPPYCLCMVCSDENVTRSVPPPHQNLTLRQRWTFWQCHNRFWNHSAHKVTVTIDTVVNLWYWLWWRRVRRYSYQTFIIGTLSCLYAREVQLSPFFFNIELIDSNDLFVSSV